MNQDVETLLSMGDLDTNNIMYFAQYKEEGIGFHWDFSWMKKMCNK